MEIILNDDYICISNTEREQTCINRQDLSLCTKTTLDGTHINFNFIIGSYKINNITFLALATSFENVCEFWNVKKVSSFKIIALNKGKIDPLAESLLTQGLSLTPLYYSDSNDLSLSSVLQSEQKPSRIKFIWNYFPLEQLYLLTNNRSYGHPIITGFISAIKREKYEIVLISRRCRIRAGTRYWMRGADEEGNAANYVETEQIFSFRNKLNSFVQIRGSVPLSWTQHPIFGQLPCITFADDIKCEKSLNSHFKKLHDEYGQITAVALTQSRGREKELSAKYGNFAQKIDYVSYIYWNFFLECKNLHYENIDKLIDIMRQNLNEIGYTSISLEDGSMSVETIQKGVVRTNCLDCLDRTNCVQSVIGKMVIENLLKLNGINEFICLSDFRNIWTDNANELSTQYSGTPAIKTELTRTGKLTLVGKVKDIMNSTQRFYINMFSDGTRQDAYDAVTQEIECKGYKKSDSNVFLAIIIVILSLLPFVFNMIVKGKKAASIEFKKTLRKVVNHPQFRYNKNDVC